MHGPANINSVAAAASWRNNNTVAATDTDISTAKSSHAAVGLRVRQRKRRRRRLIKPVIVLLRKLILVKLRLHKAPRQNHCIFDAQRQGRIALSSSRLEHCRRRIVAWRSRTGPWRCRHCRCR